MNSIPRTFTWAATLTMAAPALIASATADVTISTDASNWTITRPTSSTDATPITVNATKVEPLNVWNDTLGRDWLHPTADPAGTNFPAGQYIYSLTFTEANGGTYNLQSKTVTDNYLDSIWINGTQVWDSPSDAEDYTYDEVFTTDFVATLLSGENTIQFYTTNLPIGDQPTGPSAENPVGFTGQVTYAPVPEAGTAGLAGLALAGMMIRRRR